MISGANLEPLERGVGVGSSQRIFIADRKWGYVLFLLVQISFSAVKDVSYLLH